MSYDCSADSDKLTGAFTSTYDVSGAAAFTIACWIRKSAAQWAATTDNRFVMISDDTADDDDAMQLYTLTTANRPSAGVISTSSVLRRDFIDHTINTLDDTWILVGGVFRSNADREAFVNGTLSGSPETTTADIAPVGAAIAVGGATYSDFLSGECLVAEVGMWDVALSTGEIASLWTSAQTGPAMSSVQAANCVGYWPLLADNSTHANLGTDAGGLLTVQSAMPHSPEHPTITGSSVPVLHHARQLFGMI